VTGAGFLIDTQQDGVAVAIETGFDQTLRGTESFTLAPQAIARARPVAGPARY